MSLVADRTTARTKLIVTFCALMFALNMTAVLAQETGRRAGAGMSTADVVARVTTAMVSIRTTRANGDTISGSGFVVNSSGLVATNFHVVEDATVIQIKLANGDEYEVIDVYAFDAKKDLAILRIPGFDLATVVLGNSKDMRPGDDVIAIGDPIGLDRTVSKGVLSATREMDGFRVMQMDASISPGSSGGPILNSTGSVVGIVSFKLTAGEQLNFGIPINYLRGLLAVDRRLSVDDLSAGSGSASLFGNSEPVYRPGVFVTGYGSTHTFGQVHIDVLNHLSEMGVVVANVPTEWEPVRGDAVALPYILEKIREIGKNELLYITSQNSYGFWGGKAGIELQCYRADGILAWKSQVKVTGSWTSSSAIEKVRKKLGRILDAKSGEPCLTVGRATESEK